MKDYQQRVIDEKDELDGKLEKLNNFIDSDGYDSIEDGRDKDLLDEQLQAMSDYSDILGKRIDRF